MSEGSADYRRAAVCIGVDHVAGLPPLAAAASGAASIAAWAADQGCRVKLHTDSDGSAVSRRTVFESVRDLVATQQFDQLLIYFAGHGVLLAPGTETWLLSDAATDAAESVNMLLSAEHARRAGIPHVVFISDACRTRPSPPFTGLTGTIIFPLPGAGRDAAELDIYFATSPGNPAYEVQPTDGRTGYGIFTQCLLDVATRPPRDIIEYIASSQRPGLSTEPGLPVVTSRALKRPLIEAVANRASHISALLDQEPQIRVETVLPRFFATVDPDNHDDGRKPVRNTAAQWLDIVTEVIGKQWRSRHSARTTPYEQVEALISDFDTTDADLIPRSGRDSLRIVVRGDAAIESITALGWEPALREGREGMSMVELVPAHHDIFHDLTSAVVQFTDGTGTVVAAAPNSNVTVVVRDGRVEALDYFSRHRAPVADRFRKARAVELARLTVAAMGGEWYQGTESTFDILNRGQRSSPRGRFSVSTDFVVPGTLAGYASSELGRFQTELYYAAERQHIVPFDLALLTSRNTNTDGPQALADSAVRRGFVHPFVPVMTRGWLLMEDHLSPVRSYHRALARHLVPALYTTFDADGVGAALDVMLGEDLS